VRADGERLRLLDRLSDQRVDALLRALEKLSGGSRFSGQSQAAFVREWSSGDAARAAEIARAHASAAVQLRGRSAVDRSARRNGMFYIKDLGSTNGIDYKGMRIDNKRIDEGDVFHICDYELRFTYR